MVLIFTTGIGFLMMLSIHYTLFLVTISTALLGAAAGALGVYIFLRKQSLMTDAISHATLPGIILFFLIFQTNNPLLLMTGGMITGMLGSVFVSYVHATTRLSIDALLGVVLSVFFGCGLVLMTQLQKTVCARQAVLNKFLFGNAALLLQSDLMFILPVVIFVLISIWLYSRMFQLYVFNKEYAQVLGFNTALINTTLTGLLLLVVAVGLSVVGVILMSTLIVAPGVAARQWSSRCNKVVILAAFFGAASAVIGSYISSIDVHMPTGPIIAVVSITWTCISLLIAPHRGILWHAR